MMDEARIVGAIADAVARSLRDAGFIGDDEDWLMEVARRASAEEALAILSGWDSDR